MQPGVAIDERQSALFEVNHSSGTLYRKQFPEVRMKQLSRMTAEDLKQIVEEAIEKKLYEIVQDPDAGLRLRPEVRRRLRNTLRAERRGAKGIPAAQVARRLALRW